MIIRTKIFFLLPAVALLSLTSCQDQELLDRIDALETELEEVKTSTLSEVTIASDDLARRVTVLEKDALSKDTLASQQEDRFKRIEQTFSEALNDQQNKKVYLPNGTPENKILQTKLGSFLVKLEGIDQDPATGSLKARIRLGNPTNVSLNEFTLTGDYGDLAPELQPGEQYDAYSKRLDTWERGLTPFQQKLTQEMVPNSWNLLEVALPSGTNESRDMIRFSLSADNARLSVSGSSLADDEYANFHLDRNQASVLKTEYGGFLISPLGQPKIDSKGHFAFVKIGNPTGLSVGRSKLTGKYGPAPPMKEPDETPEDHNQRISAWKTTLVEFEAQVADKLLSGKWTSTKFLVPESDVSKMQFFRLKLIVENVSLL